MRRVASLTAGLLVTAVVAGCIGRDDSGATSVVGPPERRPTAVLVTNESVEAVAVAGDVVYAGGYFDYVGRRTGSLAVFSNDEQPESAWPRIEGGELSEEPEVLAIASDGSGGWIIGGSFETVGGTSCPRLAHLTRSKTLDRRFCIRPDGAVRALVTDGRTVFVGGSFHHVDGKPRVRLAALSLRSGQLLSWRADVTGHVFSARGGNDYAVPSVWSLAVSQGTLYVGGFFERVAGVSRHNLAAISADTAQPLPWRADATERSAGGGSWYDDVDVLAAGDEYLYVAGHFSELAGAPTSGVGAVALSSGARVRWRPQTDARVKALAYANGTVYLATESSRVSAVDAVTGTPSGGFASKDASGIDVLSVVGSTLYVGGDFGEFGGRERSNLAALDRRSGRVLSWAPRTNGDVRALAGAGEAVAVGGGFSSAGGVARHGLVAIDGRTGTILPWAPRMDAAPVALAVTKSQLYVGGMFDAVNGEKRSGLAAFDLATRRLTDWAPTLSDELFPDMSGAEVLCATDETVYVGGLFDAANDESRIGLAAFDAELGSVTPWIPDLDQGKPGGAVDLNALVAAASSVLIAGNFVRIGGAERDGLAELDDETGEVMTWDPSLGEWDPYAYEYSPFDATALGIGGDALYVGGTFLSFDGEPRKRLAAVDTDTNDVLPWNPTLEGEWVEPSDIAVAAPWVVIVGRFARVGAVRHEYVVVVDQGLGDALSWRPPREAALESAPSSVAASSTTLAFNGSVGGPDSISVYRFTKRGG